MPYETESRVVTSPAGVPVFEAHPVEPGRFPAVVVLHERYGLVEHTRDIATRLAGDGYCVLAPNLYFEYPDQEALARGEATTRISDPRAIEILEDVVPLFGGLASADPERLAMLGACATGRYPVVWGADHPLQACIVLHGLYRNREWEPDGDLHLEPLQDLVARMDAPILGLFGELDNLVSVDDVRFIRDNFEECNRCYRIVLYAGAPHGWMNSTMPGRYRPEVTEISWQELVGFLRRTLTTGPVPDPQYVEWSFSLVKHRDYDFANNRNLR